MRDGKKVVITYGTYDLLHFGHIALLKRARALGDFLIVGITSDAFDKQRGKFNVSQSLVERIEAVRSTGLADMIVVEEYRGQKIADIQKYHVDVFAIGSDWRGKFDYLEKYCEVVYLERTKGVSSTELREKDADELTIGCIGCDYLSDRFVRESSFVLGAHITAAWDEDEDTRNAFCRHWNLQQAASIDDLLDTVDAVYISLPINERFSTIEQALRAGCHVIAEGPQFLSTVELNHARTLAQEGGLILFDAVKTRYFPAFEHLKLLLESGIIGEVKDIDASFSHVFDELDKANRYEGSFYDMASYILLPAVDFLAPDFLRKDLICRFEGDFCTWTKCNLTYASSTATLRTGRGMKTEGDMTITGTDGFLYIPSPWWLMNYFELRTEDLRATKRFYFEYAGEGQRYELAEFMRIVFDKNRQDSSDGVRAWARMEAVTRLVEAFDRGDIFKLTDSACAFGGGETVVD